MAVKKFRSLLHRISTSPYLYVIQHVSPMRVVSHNESRLGLCVTLRCHGYPGVTANDACDGYRLALPLGCV